MKDVSASGVSKGSADQESFSTLELVVELGLDRRPLRWLENIMAPYTDLSKGIP